MKVLGQLVRMRETSPLGATFDYFASEGLPWATAEAWCSALQFPSESRFKIALDRAVENLRHSTGDECVAKSEKFSQPLYLWHAVDEALRIFDRAYHEHGYRKHVDLGVPVERWDQFMGNYNKLRKWIADLAARALMGEVQKHKQASVAAPTSMETMLGDVLQKLAAVSITNTGRIGEHDLVIGALKEQPFQFRDPAEFVSVKTVAMERAIDQSLMPRAPAIRLTICQLVGNLLAKNGVERGPRQLARLEGSAADACVNTYRRSDVIAAFDEILGRS